ATPSGTGHASTGKTSSRAMPPARRCGCPRSDELRGDEFHGDEPRGDEVPSEDYRSLTLVVSAQLVTALLVTAALVTAALVTKLLRLRADSPARSARCTCPTDRR